MVVIGYSRRGRHSLRIYRIRRNAAIAFSAFMLVFLGIFIPLGNTPAEIEAITDLTGDPTITINSTKDSASVAIEATAVGAFGATSGNQDIAFSVSTSNYTGYELSARSTKTTMDNGTSSLSSITSDVTADEFSDSTNTHLNNRWGYKPNFYDSLANTKFYGITTSAVVLDRTAAANSTAKNYTISIGARVNLDTPSGAYVNDNIILEAVANVVPSAELTVNYGNGITAITIGGTTIPDGEVAKLITGVPYAIAVTLEDGYAFGAWDASAGTIGDSTLDSTTYTIGSADATLSAYATYTGRDMQNLSTEYCTSTPDRVKDTRDNHVYTIQRLADGNCWMMENLDLGRTDISTNLNSTNTNINTTINASTFNGWRKTVSSSTYAAGELIPVSGADATSGTHYGTLYNYYAASAGTISGDTNANDATYDICPAGWRLPAGGTEGEFAALYSLDDYNTNAKMRAPVGDGGAAFALAGDFVTIGSGEQGRYWASTRAGDNRMNYMYLNLTAVVPDSNNVRSSGFSIRCVLKKQIGNLAYLQDFKDLTKEEVSSVAASMADKTAYNLIDNRDNRTYSVAKLKDGKIWMAENLDLGRTPISTDLTRDNTNLATTVEATTFNGWKKTSGTSTYTAGEYIAVDGVDSMTDVPHKTLYNYYAATAGTITGSSNSASAIYDICPAGWRMPTGNSSSGDWRTLTYNSAYNTNAKIRASIENGGAAITFNGIFSSGVPSSMSTYGYYWSSTNYSTQSVYNMYIYSSGSIYPTSSLYRYYGASIRCLVKKPVHTVTVSYGANINNVKLNGTTMSNGDTIELEEGQSYSLSMDRDAGYSTMTWSATSGTIASTTAISTTYTIGTSDATITATVQKASVGDIRNVTTSTCPTADSFATDTRDGREYIIKKLNDGNCWMMENLDLGRTELTTDLTSSNTNIDDTISASTFNSWKKATGSQNANDGEYIPLTTSNTSNGLDTDPTSKTGYGTLYNYYAASGGTISGSTNENHASYDICPAGWRLPIGGTSGEFQKLYSYYGSNASMRNSIINNGAAFNLPGAAYSEGPSQQGQKSIFWSSTLASSANMYDLYLTTSSVNVTDNSSRENCYNIRCIAKKPTRAITITYDSGIANVKVRGIMIQNGGVINLEQNATYPIVVTTVSGYKFSSWTASSGTFASTTLLSTTYTPGANDATLNATSSFTGPDLQNMDISYCSAVPYTAKDTRDGHIYTIQLLSDNRCWMMENLDLGRTALTTDLTSANTNIAGTISASTFNSWKKTSGTETYTDGEYISLDGVDSVSDTEYGTLYNYYAASAGTVSGSSNSSNAAYDICPSGWRLPTGGASGELKALYDAYNSFSSMHNSIDNHGAAFPLSGAFTNSTPISIGTVGNYWSSTVDPSDDTSMSHLYLSELNTTTANTSSRKDGQSIRCIRDENSTVAINYDANGNYFDNDVSHTSNTVEYSLTAVPNSNVTKYSHTPNISNSGVRSGDYANSYTMNEVITIPGAQSLHIKLTYQTESTSYDWVSFWTGRHPEYTAYSDYSLGVQVTGTAGGKYGGGNRTIETDIEGDTVTFGFRSDGSVTNYGYYAVITGVGIAYSKTTLAGEYKTPTLPEGYYLVGWSENANGTGTTYADEDDVLNNYTPTAGGANTLYAKISNKYNINLKSATGLSSVVLSKNGSNICSTSNTTTGVNCTLTYGETYNLTANLNTGYKFDNWQLDGSGTIGGVSSITTTYTAGAGTATITPIVSRAEYTLTVVYDPGVINVTVDNTPVANNGTVTLVYNTSYQIAVSVIGGYTFNGWTATSGTIGSAVSQGTTYTIGNSDATLTAATTFNGPDLQNLDLRFCTSRPYAARDTRDGRIYIVKALADGKCWMMENLDLGRTTLTTDLTSANTNITSTISASTFNSWKKTSGGGTYTSGEFILLDGEDAVSKTAYGTLYNFYAASGGTISGSSSIDAEYDICPAGWRLPTGSESGEFRTLYNAYHSYNQIHGSIFDGGLAFPLSGAFSDDVPYNIDVAGMYWSSTADPLSAGYMDDFYVSESVTTTNNSSMRRDGHAIRCIKNETHSLTINFDANGRYYDDDSSYTMNTIQYDVSETLGEEMTKYSHTPNIDDAGVQNGTYSNNYSKTEVVTIPGARSVHVTLTYQTESTSFDWVSFWAGSHPNYTAYNNYSTGIQVAGSSGGKYGNNVKNTIEVDVPSSSVTFAFRSDGSVVNYGYYAVVTGIGGAYSRVPVSGTYKTPVPPTGSYFVGWSENADGSGDIYADENEIMENYTPKSGGVNTLYAIMDNKYDVTLKSVTGLTNATITKDGDTICTSTSTTGIICRLTYNETYTVTANVGTGFTFDSWSMTGAGTLGDTSTVTTTFTADAGAATITPAVTRNNYTLTVSYGEGVSSVSVGGTVVPDGGTISLPYNTSTSIAMTPLSGYTINKWTATSGSISSSTSLSTYYYIGAGDATLSVSGMFTIQNLEYENCTTTASQVRDTRDSRLYTIKRLGDGNCWMMENLDFGRSYTYTNLTSANTNIATTISYSTYNNWRKSTSTASNSAGEMMSVSGTDSASGTTYGVLYNYYAATLGTITGDSVLTDARYDICPAGWRLPTGGSSGEFTTLHSNSKYNSLEKMRAPIANAGAAFALAGSFSDTTSVVGAGTQGYYWTSTRNDESSMYTMSLSTSNLSTTSTGARSNGYSIRCVMKKQIPELTYMQDFANLTADERSSVLASMKDNTTYELADSRDNKTYKIAKMKDGNVWMAENLDLGRTALTTDLTTDNTNLSATVTASTFNAWKKSAGTETDSDGELVSLEGSDSTSGNAYGTLYNYFAASAGTVSGNSYGNNVEYDICPAGWRLPTGADIGEFKTLSDNESYNTYTNIRASITNGGTAFALAGTFATTPTSQDSYGGYWSSTLASGTEMYRFGLDTTSFDSSAVAGRETGYSIRCIAKKPAHTLTVSYNTGITNVKVNGVIMQNGGMINLEEDVTYSITATPNPDYETSVWSATSGTLGIKYSLNSTYMIGKEDATLSIGGYAPIQNLASTSCTTTPTQYVDSRDGNIYTAQRLADGKCWMMENLNLGHEDLVRDLTSDNTNIVNTVTAATFNSWRRTSSTSSYTSAAVVPVDGVDSVAGTAYGTLYDFYSASAGTITGGSSSINSSYDICPAKWRLPTGGGNGEFQALYTNSAYNTVETMRASVSDGGAAFALAGYFTTGTQTSKGSSGRYWSSSYYDYRRMYRLNLSTSSVSTTDYAYRYYGASIRCVLEETSITDLTSMQDFKSLTAAAKSSVRKSMVENTIYNLIDNRDNRSYQIAKLKDGNIWMAENLDLGRTDLAVNLTSANTNLYNTVSYSTFNAWKKTAGTETYNSGEFIPLEGTDTSSGTSYGTLYNYYAASVYTITGSSNNSNATYDLCPAGWRLPSATTTGVNEFDQLYTNSAYDSRTKILTPVTSGGAGFALSGLFGASAPEDQETSGTYWTSSAVDYYQRKGLVIDASDVNTNASIDRKKGYAIRCIVK